MRNKNIVLFIVLALISTLAQMACKKVESPFYTYENEIKEFNGNALEYLEAQSKQYDSLLLIINRLPLLKDALENEELTVFAITDKSFEISINNLNKSRKIENKEPIYLSDIDVDQLDTLVSRYLIKGSYTTDDFQKFSSGLLVKSINHEYEMHVLYNKDNASGFIEGGPQILIFSDPKGSTVVDFWERSTTNAVNIKTRNAIINIVAPSHGFGFNELITRVDN